MKRIAIGIAVLLLALGGVFYFFQSKDTNSLTVPTKVVESSPAPTPAKEIQASFAIFTNGTFRIFTDAKYHNRSDEVFIQTVNPNIVQVKRVGVTWNDFFKTLPMKLSRDCLTTGTGQVFCSSGDQQLRFYINGQKDPGALDKVIVSGDKLLVSFGNPTEKELANQLDQVPSVK